MLDLWRSLLDGMPIGLFYLQLAGRKVVDPKCRTRLVDAPEDGAWDLFDGQQRVRALGLGAGDPFGDREVTERTAGRGVFVPLVFPPCDAFQFDWSEDWAEVGSKRVKLQAARTKLAHSRAL